MKGGQMRKSVIAVVAAFVLLVPAGAAMADPIIDACNNVDPDVHVTVGDVAEACFDYPG